MEIGNKVRLIAFYLPQYHPIPENDAWWGKGFTEWTNVAKAKPLFKGHYQPHIPADLGFYDLRVPETREAQAILARKAGIEGFCYWHNWYAGKRILERPFDEVLESGKPDYPFCIGWDNETWTGIWHNSPDRILIEQTYPGIEDHIAHFNNLLPAFRDKRYIKVDGKPLFVIFRGADLSKDDLEIWRSLAISAGLAGLFFLGNVKNDKEITQIREYGYDACTVSKTAGRVVLRNPLKRTLAGIFGEARARNFYHKMIRKPFYVFDYKDVVPFFDVESSPGFDNYPAIMPNWDNTPRAGLNGHVWINATPELFKDHLMSAIKLVANYPDQHKIIIIKSWNEWAEGNTLEPDLKFGHGFLEAIRKVMEK